MSFLFAAIRAIPATPAPGVAATPSPMPAPVAGGDGMPLPEIRDIAPPIDVFPYPAWVVAVAAVAALAVVAAIVIAVVRARRNRPAPPPPTPRSIALRELEALRGQVRTLDPYAFSVAVSDVLRRYIGAQYGLRAPQQTSPEFLASIGNSASFSAEDRALLADFLERCDLIKFARIPADESSSEALLGSASAFVQGGKS